jgi:GAF domain-containing protein
MLLKADSAVIWPYNAKRKRFVIERVTVVGLSEKDIRIMQQPVVGDGGVTDTIRKTGYRFIENVENPDYESFIGKLAQNFYFQTGIKCFAGVDLKVGEETMGVLYLNYNKSTSFSKDNETTLKAFATEAAVAIKKARLYQQVNRALEHLETTADFMRLGKIEDVLRSLTEGVQEALNCDAITLYRYDENKKEIPGPPMILGLKNEAAARKMEDLGPDSTLGKILQLGEYYTEDSANDPIMQGGFIEREGVCCSAGIALKMVEHTLGILFINYRTPYHFTEEDKQLFHTFASLAAIAIRNAELYEADKKWSEHLAHLYEAGKAVTTSVDKDEILKTLLDEALEITGIYGKRALFGNILIYHPESDEMVFTHARPEGELEKIRKRMGDRIRFRNNPNGKTGITGKAVKTRSSQWVPDIEKDPDYLPYHPDTKSEIAVPLIDRDKNIVIGALNVEHAEKNGLDANDKRALKMLATQAVIAVQKAEQFEELKKTQKILAGRTALAFMGMASSTWRHEINKYASVISDYISLLEKELSSGILRLCRPFGKKVKRMEEYVQTSKKLVSLIHKTPITAPLSSEEAVESIPVNALVKERVSRVVERYELFHGVSDIDVKWAIELPDDARIRVSREWLRRGIDILVMNALDAMEGAAQKVLLLKTYAIQNSVEIGIANTGTGIPEGILKKLFKEPIPKKIEEKGSGMGLLLAQQIMQTYRGDIRVVSAGPPVTEFAISLPLERAYEYAR